MIKVSNIKLRPNTNVCEIVLDDAKSIDLFMDVVLKFKISKNQNIDETLWSEILQENDCINAKRSAYNFASYSARTEFQVIKKLTEMGFNETHINPAMESLREFNLIDDYIFCQKFIAYYLKRKKSGADRIKLELLKKGVPANIAENALIDFFPKEDELEIIRAAIEKKLRTLQNKPKEKRKRSLIDYLQRQGFAYSLIKQGLLDYSDEFNNDEEYYDD